MLTKLLSSLLIVCLTITSLNNEALAEESKSSNNKKLEQITEQQKKEFLELRFGMFICLGIATYNEIEWATGKDPASSFNPKKLDCNQWAKAAKSAGMQYGLLTTQHVGGFSLWDTSVSEYDVASSPYGKDIVRQYVDAFRKHGLKVGLYLSIWDAHHNIATGHVTRKKVEHIKTQLTELLTNYGEVETLWLDGYQHERRGRPAFPTTTDVPYGEIRELVKRLQPKCLILRHPGLSIYDTEFTDVQVWEGIFVHEPTRIFWKKYQREHPEGVQEVCDTMQRGWYWKVGMDKQPVKSVDYAIDKLKICLAHNSNYLLNAAINRDGLVDQNVVDRFAEIGEVVRKEELLTRSRDEFKKIDVSEKPEESATTQAE